MSIVEATYASVTESNVILGETLPWDNAETAEKQTALEWAVVYMNTTYQIPISAINAPVQALKNANAMLANAQLPESATDTGSIFTAVKDAAPAKGLIGETIKADVVSSSKLYDPYVSKQWTDPYPAVSAMLANAGFILTKRSGLATVPMIRR